MKKLFILICAIPFIVNAQVEKGIHFESDLGWQEVLNKAKVENKYIFVDCYASWCGPCKQMDKRIYPNDTIGDLINKDFISIKVQFDTSKNDNEEIKSWYPVAHRFINEYDIRGFPTFLFFSPNGEIVHKDFGYKSVQRFVIMASNALNESKQNYTLIHKYKSGLLELASLRELALTVKELGNDELANCMAKDYMHSYLDKLEFNSFATKENINFLYSFYTLLSTKDRAFELFYSHARFADSITNNDRGFANSYAYYLIFNEQVSPKLDFARDSNVNPNWKAISDSLIIKYPKIDVDDMVLNAQLSWYKFKKNWVKYSQLLVDKVEKKDLDNYTGWNGIMTLNSSAFDIFLYSSNKKFLNKAIIWSEKSMQLDKKPNVGLMDTKGSLLYKIGRKKEAILLYKQIVQMDSRFAVTLKKMEKGLPTWNDEQLFQ